MRLVDFRIGRTSTFAATVLLSALLLGACDQSVAASRVDRSGSSSSAARGGTVATTSAAAGSHTIPVTDARLGLSEGTLTLLPGWHGTAHADRTSDPEGGGTATLVVDLRSDDGTMSERSLPVAFRTYSPQLAASSGAAPMPGMNLLQFTSTADLLVQRILPRLGLRGRVSAPVPVLADKRRQILDKVAASGMQDPIFDAAAVTVRGGDGRETMVVGITFGGQRGTAREMTTTSLTLLEGPVGTTKAVFEAAGRLPEMQQNAAWVAADRRLNDDKLAAIARQGEATRAQSNASSEAQNRMFQQNMAANRASFDQHNRAWAQHEQAVTDGGALFRGYLGGHDVSYDWCNGATGDRQTVTNSTVSPGAGYTRC